MSKSGHIVEVVLVVLTGAFIAAGFYQMEERAKLGWFFIALSCMSFVVLLIWLFKGRKRYGVAELARDMESMSVDLADFAGERGRSDPINRSKMPKPDWDDERKHEEFEEQRRELMEHGSETIRIYRRRFAAKVNYLVREARKFGYEDEELDRLYQHPVNRLSIEMLSDKMGALSLRMKKEMR